MGGKGNLLQAIAGAAMFFFGPAGGWIASLGRSLLASVVLGAVGKALQKKPSASGTTMAAQGRLETVRQALGPRQVVYGRVRVGGTLTFFETTTDNQTALMITTLTGHPVSNIRDVYYNDRSTLDYGSHGSGSAAGGKFAGYSTVYRSSGTEGASQPFGDLVARGLSWASTDLQRDCAKVHTTHAFSNEVWQTGLPQVSCVIDGVFDIIDPRLGSPTGTRWTNNPALCIAHYLASVNGLSADYGSEIDQATLIASANICDERVLLSGTRTATVADVQPSADAIVLAVGSVHFDFGDGLRFSTGSPTTLPGGISEGVTYYAIPVMEGDVTIGQYIRIATSYENAMAGSFMDISSTGSGTITVTHYDEPRYRLNGAFSLTEKPQAVIERMLMAMAGKLVNSGGVWYLYAGAYSTPTLTFDEDDFAGPIDVQTNLSRSENANAVKGTFVDPSSRYQPVDFPAVLSQTYYQEDGGERVYRDLDLTAFVTSSTQAQRLAKIDLITTRVGLTCHARFKLSAFRMMTGATVAINNTHLGWTAKAFEVMNCTLVIERDGRLEVDATLRETAAEIYDWNVSEEQLADLAPNTNLPDPTTVAAPTGLTFAQSDQVFDTGVLTFTAPSDAFVADYQAAYRFTDFGSPADSEYTLSPFTTGKRIEIPRLFARSYQFKVRGRNTFGAVSDWTDVVIGEMSGDRSNWVGALNGTGQLQRIGAIEISGANSCWGMTWNPRTGLIYVGGGFDNTIYAINPVTDTIISTITVSDWVSNIEYCPRNGKLYAQRSGSSAPYKTIAVLNPYTLQLTDITAGQLTLAGENQRAAWCPADNRMWFANGTLLALNPDDDSVTSYTMPQNVQAGLCYCPTNQHLYACGLSSDKVFAVNPLFQGSPTIDMVAATINVPDTPTSVCYCPVNDRIYVTCRNGGDVVVIDPATNSIESNIGGSPSSFNRPFSITYSPATRLLYVVEDYAPGSPTVGYILSIDPVTNEIVSRTIIGQGYCSLLFIPGVNKLYSGRFAPYGGSPDAEVQVLSI